MRRRPRGSISSQASTDGRSSTSCHRYPPLPVPTSKPMTPAGSRTPSRSSVQHLPSPPRSGSVAGGAHSSASSRSSSVASQASAGSASSWSIGEEVVLDQVRQANRAGGLSRTTAAGEEGRPYVGVLHVCCPPMYSVSDQAAARALIRQSAGRMRTDQEDDDLDELKKKACERTYDERSFRESTDIITAKTGERFRLQYSRHRGKSEPSWKAPPAARKLGKS